MKWSDEQQAAIISHDTNELLNAGAGSGKTAVLSEHVIYLLQHGYTLKQLLIMTFTNSAANEMKQRIKQKIEAIPELNDKYGDEVEAAHIETFDAFYLYLVNKYNYIFKLDGKVNILDGNIEAILTKRFIEEVLNTYYESDNSLFKDLVKRTCVKHDGFLYDVIIEILHQAGLQIDRDGFLNHYLDEFFSDEYIEKMIADHYQLQMDLLNQIRKSVDLLENDEDRESIYKFLDEFDECKSYDEFYYKCINSKFPTKTGGVSSDKPFRDAIKKIYDSNFLQDNANYGYAKDIKDTQLTIKPMCELLFKIAREVDEKLLAFKYRFNSFTFADVTAMALKLMEMPEVLKEVKDSFRYILIDEYQDTNDIQEEFVKKLENNNVFMVGDVKQSIYRFRHANCMIFQNKYNKYKHGGKGGHAIDMTQNFRSRKELVEDFNTYFSQLMDARYNLIDYSDGHNTKFGFTDYLKGESKEQLNGIHFFRYSKSCLKSEDHKYSAAEYEANIIANDIINKINNGYQVYDKNSPTSLRPCEFKDFAIIIATGTNFPVYKRVFADYSIPLYVYNDEDVSSNLIFMLSPNLLKVYRGVKNHQYDVDFIHAFVSISRSFIFSRDDESIFNTVNNKDFDNDEIILLYKEVIKDHDGEPVADIFNALLNKFDVYSKLKSIGDYLYNSAYIQNFVNLIKNMDVFNFSVDEVIEYFKDLKEANIEIKANPIKESDNSVILLNIHKSKGLEYPIVYYPGMTVAFNRKDLNAQVILSSKHGPILPDEICEFKQIARNINKNDEIQQDYEEKLRLLYVALTRAKESAIIVDQYGEDELPLTDPRQAVCFHQMLKGVVVGKDVSIDKTDCNFNGVLNIQDTKKDAVTFELKDLPSIQFNEISKARASKVASADIDQDALDFGNKMHLLLELVDMDNKDLSFIKSEKEKHYVEKVLNLDIFKGIDNEHVRHEFAFYDDTKELLGIIDCLLIKDSEIDIIDYKLKNIDDKAYQKQLQTYYDYIKTITNKEVKTFLISIINGEIQEVKMDE